MNIVVCLSVVAVVAIVALFGIVALVQDRLFKVITNGRSAHVEVTEPTRSQGG